MGATGLPIYQPDHYLDDLRLCVKHRGLSVSAAAHKLGLSRATAYRIIKQAAAAGRW